MTRSTDIVLTALAPAVWGSSYLVTTEFLPDGYPLTAAILRALPAGLILLLMVRHLPAGRWWGKAFVLGAFNFSIFWTLLFVAAYRLPGGVAATVGAVQPLVVLVLARSLLGTPILVLSVFAALAGAGGVALVILTPDATLDPIGIAAGLGGAVSMAFGTVLSRKWQTRVPLISAAAWQLTAGGLLLAPAAFLFEPALPSLTAENLLGFAYLGLIGGALTYVIWFRGLRRLEPSVASMLGLLSPLTAVVLGWSALDQGLGVLQIAGAGIVLASVWLSQRAARRPAPAAVPPHPVPQT